MHPRILPETRFNLRIRDESISDENPFRWQEVTTSDLFADKRVIIFALPGAFTPTCSSTHLPRYEELFDEFKAEGIDQVWCISVNDAFVMFNWGRQIGVQNVGLLPDGNGDFTRLMGMLVDKRNLGFGQRSWRYAMVVHDRTIEQMFVEAGISDDFPSDPFEKSDADTVLAWLKGIPLENRVIKRRTFIG
jgi:peroxiredoxin